MNTETGRKRKPRYTESYRMWKVKNPGKMGMPGKNYCVAHYKPMDGGTWVENVESKFFENKAEAEAFIKAQEDRLKKKGKEATI